MSESAELLGFALEALDEIDTLIGHGYDEFAASLDRQRALAFCWIAVGSALKDYTRVVQIPTRQEPLSSPIRFRDRLAHQSLSLLDPLLLWRVSVERVAELRARPPRPAGFGAVNERPYLPCGTKFFHALW